MKKIIRGMLAVVLASSMMLMTTGCKNDENSKSSGSSVSSVNLTQTRKIENYFDCNDIGRPGMIDYITDLRAVNGKIYVYGTSMAGLDAAEFYNFNVSSKSIERFNLEKSTYPTAIALKNGKFYTTSIDEENGVKVYIHDSNYKCESEIKVSDSTDTMVYGIAAGESGDIYVETISSSGMSIKNDVIVYGSDGKEKKRVSLNDLTGVKGFSIFQLLIGDETTGFFTVKITINPMTGAFTDTAIYKLNSNLEIESEIHDLEELGTLSNLFLTQNNTLMAVGYDVESSAMCYINEIDVTTGETINRYEIPDTFIAQQGIDGKHLTYYTEDGLFSFSLEDGKSEELYSFAGDDVPQGFKDMNLGIASQDGNLVLYTVPEDVSPYSFYIMDTEGNFESTVSLTSPSQGSIAAYSIASDGNIYYIVELFDVDRTDSDNGLAKCTMELYIADPSGNIINTFSVSDFNGNESTYVSSFSVDAEGRAYFIINSDSFDNGVQLYVMDKDGNIVSTNNTSDVNNIESLISSGDGKVYCKYSDSNDVTKFAILNPEDGKIGEAISLTGVNITSSADVYDGSGEYDIFVNDKTALYGYNFEKNEAKELINWLDSDFTEYFNSLAVIDENNIACVGRNQKSITDESTICILKRADEARLEKINSRDVITAAGCNISAETASQISKFNKSNDNVRIQFTDYAKYNTADDEENGVKQLNNDIIKGNIPDIILVDTSMNIDMYIKKGMLADLSSYIENDSQINRADYLENIFEIGSYDGKLYQIIPSFTLNALIGKTSVIGESGGWTVSEFMNFADECSTDMFFMVDKASMLKMFATSMIRDCVDFKESKCDFNNENVISILEFIKENAEEKKDTNDNESYKEYQMRFINNKCALDYQNIYDYNDFNLLQAVFIQEEASIKGIPSKSGSGMTINFSSSFAISEKSAHKDVAWEFIREYLLDDYQNSIIDGDYSISGFPVKSSVLDQSLEKAQDASKNIYESYPIGDDIVQVTVISDESAKKLTDAIKSTSSASKCDETIFGIIKDEAETFFSGTATASEAAESIQNKVKHYLDEIK